MERDVEMPAPFIEHVNITVSDANRSAALLRDLFGWRDRWEGPSLNGGRSIHVGDDRFYLALYTPPGGDATRYPKGQPLQHIGLVVDDLDGVEAKVIAAGLTPFSHGDYEPGRRFYFLDHDGIEFEIVSYSRAAA